MRLEDKTGSILRCAAITGDGSTDDRDSVVRQSAQSRHAVSTATLKVPRHISLARRVDELVSTTRLGYEFSSLLTDEHNCVLRRERLVGQSE